MNKDYEKKLNKEVEKYKSKLTVKKKKPLNVFVTAACTLAVLGGLIAGHFAYKAAHAIANNHEIVLDPTIETKVVVSEIVTTEEGDKQCDVRSYEKEMTDVKVTIGDNLLKEGTDYKKEIINDTHIISGYKVTIYKESIKKYEGSIKITPQFNDQSSEILEKKIAELQVEIETQKTEIAKQKETIQRYEDEIKGLNEKIEDLEKKGEEAQEKIKKLTAEKEKLEADLKAAEDELLEKQAKIDKLAKDLEVAEKALEEEQNKVVVTFVDKDGLFIKSVKVVVDGTVPEDEFPELTANYKWQTEDGNTFDEETTVSDSCLVKESAVCWVKLDKSYTKTATSTTDFTLVATYSDQIKEYLELGTSALELDCDDYFEILDTEYDYENNTCTYTLEVASETDNEFHTITCYDTLTEVEASCDVFIYKAEETGEIDVDDTEWNNEGGLTLGVHSEVVTEGENYSVTYTNTSGAELKYKQIVVYLVNVDDDYCKGYYNGGHLQPDAEVTTEIETDWSLLEGYEPIKLNYEIKDLKSEFYYDTDTFNDQYATGIEIDSSSIEQITGDTNEITITYKNNTGAAKEINVGIFGEEEGILVDLGPLEFKTGTNDLVISLDEEKLDTILTGFEGASPLDAWLQAYEE